MAILEMNQRIVYTRPDNGRAAIFSPADAGDLDAIASKVVPAGLTWWVMDKDEIAADAWFRNAWVIAETDKGPEVVVDMAKAQDIQKAKWRLARWPLLEQLDVDFQRALEAKDEVAQAEIAAKKQALRDVTLTDMSHIQTPEELKVFWPEVLDGNP